MNPAEAVQAFNDLGARYALGIHFGTFQLTDEAHDAPEAALQQALQAGGLAGERFRTLDNGGAWDVP
jgi:L-ascorbate metabolism protein UlaG (beta-lactamase superfamily)